MSVDFCLLEHKRDCEGRDTLMTGIKFLCIDTADTFVYNKLTHFYERCIVNESKKDSSRQHVNVVVCYKVIRFSFSVVVYVIYSSSFC
jgi:hypothetical protein